MEDGADMSRYFVARVVPSFNRCFAWLAGKYKYKLKSVKKRDTCDVSACRNMRWSPTAL